MNTQTLRTIKSSRSTRSKTIPYLFELGLQVGVHDVSCFNDQVKLAWQRLSLLGGVVCNKKMRQGCIVKEQWCFFQHITYCVLKKQQQQSGHLKTADLSTHEMS